MIMPQCHMPVCAYEKPHCVCVFMCVCDNDDDDDDNNNNDDDDYE